ncbi:MAG TPA: type III polyketide synthase, partial [Alphaproteobacteria bacterium]|nr:type III polyketide synthase [Alphaproteobacteria bacterium]
LEEVFALPAGGLAAARDVLRDYGNMSAVTVLFVLDRLVREAGGLGRLGGRTLLSSLGPGFTGALALLEQG